MYKLNPKITEGAIGFVLMREKVGGGFSASPLLPPSIQDTYYAAQILRLCDKPIQNKKHKSYLLRQDIITFGPDVLRLYLETLETMDLLKMLSKRHLKEILYVLKRYKSSEDLKVLSSLVAVGRILGLSEYSTDMLKDLNKDLTNPKIRTVRDVFYAFEIYGKEFVKNFLKFLLDCQNPDGGFGFLKGTTSYMENCFYACYVLRAMGMLPMDTRRLRLFVLASRNSDGGFGRNSQCTSFLETTYFAIWLLKNIYDL